jgi:hypothetical protein
LEDYVRPLKSKPESRHLVAARGTIFAYCGKRNAALHKLEIPCQTAGNYRVQRIAVHCERVPEQDSCAATPELALKDTDPETLSSTLHLSLCAMNFGERQE